MDFYQELELVIKANTSIIYVITNEEERLEYIIRQFVLKDISQAIHTWDFIEGYYGDILSAEKIALRNPLQALRTIESFSDSYNALFLLKDFDRFFNDNSISRKLQNLSRKISERNQTIIIVSSEPNLSLASAEFMTSLYLGLPSKYEISLEITRLLRYFPRSNNCEVLIDLLSNACQGLSIIQIRSIAAKFLVQYQVLDELAIDFFVEEKQKKIKETGKLELYSNNLRLDDIGGLHLLKEWLSKRLTAFSSASVRYGLPYPKGLLLIGIQGTGKSMTAKATATFLGIALLRLDIGRLFAGVVGESESNLRQAIQIVEASAPCVLWIDEIDKAFTKNTAVGDGGTTGRVLATLLTWLSEKECPVFIVATANHVENLPSEIVRKGRFDEIFFINLPDLLERQQIFEVHLSKLRPKTWHRYNTTYLAKCSVLFSGAEIKQVIIEAMYLSFMENRELNSEDILNEINHTVPLAFTDQVNINKLQTWANLGKARLA